MLIIVLSLSVPCQGLSPESQLHSPSLLAEADTDTLMDIIEADMKELVATVRSRFELEILAMLTLQAARPRYPVPQKLLIQIHHYFLTTKDPKFRLHNDPRDEEIGYSMLYLEHLPSKKRIYFKPIFGPHYEERARNIELISRAGLPQCVPTRLVKKTDSNDRSLYYFEIDLSQEEFYPLGEVLERINQQFLVKNTPKAWEVVRPFLRNKIFAAVQEALDSLNSHQLSHGHPHQNNVMIRLSYPSGKRISPLALRYADGKVYPRSLDSLRIEV
ncbi:MAG: hypothetical protein JW774_09530, partial [Candidatus Aureabacteria bacterium]|nr:hypothetical protein [Candidatus Auribacterota bacterium]